MRLFAGTPFDRPPTCDRCGALETECKCPPLTEPAPLRTAPEKQTARLATEKRKKGKMVTVVRGLPSSANDLQELLTLLKSRCGAGGTIKEDVLEIQGEHLPAIRAALAGLGYRVQG